MDLDRHTLGSAWSLLSSVLLSPHICISVKCDASSPFIAFFLLLMILRGLPLPGHHGGEEVVWLRHHLAMPQPAQSFSRIHTPYIYYINCIRCSVNAICKLWFCCSVLRMRHLLHVRPSWGRNPSSVALPEVYSVFFPPVKFFFCSKWYVFLTWNEGRRTEDVIHCTVCKAHSGTVIVIWGYINK